MTTRNRLAQLGACLIGADVAMTTHKEQEVKIGERKQKNRDKQQQKKKGLSVCMPCCINNTGKRFPIAILIDLHIIHHNDNNSKDKIIIAKEYRQFYHLCHHGNIIIIIIIINLFGTS